MSDEADDIRALTWRVARLEAWQRTVMGTRPTPKPEIDEVAAWEARCREAGVPEETLAALRLEHAREPGEHVEALTMLAEEDTMRGRMRRGGMDV